MRQFISFVTLVVASLVPLLSHAKVLSCEANKGNGRGWIPREFQIDLASDRKTARVISPVTEVFGAKPFEKSFFGSSLWSRGKGKSDRGDYYNYQLSLDLDLNDTEAKVVMTMQGYRDNELQFRCSEGIASGPARVEYPPMLEQPRGVSQEATPRSLANFSDGDICESAVEEPEYGGGIRWESRPEYLPYVLEASRRNLSCDQRLPRPPSTARENVEQISSVALCELAKYDSLSLMLNTEFRKRDLNCPSGFQRAKLSDADICLYAVTPNGQWASDAIQFVGEARRRGLTCGVEANNTVASTGSSVQRLSQTQLCYWATAPDGQGGKRWHTSIERIEHVSEAQRRGLTCGVTERTNNAGPEVLPKFSSYRRVTIRLGEENQEGVIGFNDRKNGNVWSGTGKVLVLGELCDVSTKFDTSNRDSDFRVTCPSGYKAKGQYEPLGSGQGSVGVGTDSYDNKVQYKLHPATGGFAITRSDFEEAVRSALDAGNPLSEETAFAQASPSGKPSTPGNIEITSVRVSGAQGLVQGSVSLGLAELLVDGETVSFDSAGKFSFKTYVPAGGKQIEVVAVDRQGGAIRRDVSLTRDDSSREARVTFDSLNPTTRQVKPNTNAIALIVGVAEYSKTAPAEFADNDAQVFYDYTHLKLGIPQNRIQTLVNDEADEVGLLTGVNKWLKRSVKQGESDVYIFFAGHGLASDDGDTAYLIPYDGAPDFLERTAISRDEVFREVSSVNPRSVTVFLDTCYSGDTRGEARLIAGRPLGIKLLERGLPAGFTVLTAAAGDQIAKPLREAKHGLFSYYLMKGMEGDADTNSDNEITARELHSYVRENVVQQSGGSQVPELQGDGEKVLVRFQ